MLGKFAVGVVVLPVVCYLFALTLGIAPEYRDLFARFFSGFALIKG